MVNHFSYYCELHLSGISCVVMLLLHYMAGLVSYAIMIAVMIVSTGE